MSDFNKPKSKPAFPQQFHGTTEPSLSGLSMRDYFAARAMVAWYCNVENEASKHPDSVAIWCYQLADAMLKAREE